MRLSRGFHRIHNRPGGVLLHNQLVCDSPEGALLQRHGTSSTSICSHMSGGMAQVLEAGLMHAMLPASAASTASGRLSSRADRTAAKMSNMAWSGADRDCRFCTCA